MFTFDGANKRIHIELDAVNNNVVTFTPEMLWSRWVDWYLTGDNSKYPQALRITGGDPIGGGQYIGNYLFFRNDLGWRGVPPMVDGVFIVINGAFYAEDPNLPVMENNAGQETDLVINRSSIVTSVAGGGSTYTLDQIADAVWTRTQRELTAASTSSLTQEQNDKLMESLSVGEFIALS